MSAVLSHPPMSRSAFIEWENEQRERHEFVAGEVFAMTGARATHNTIALNIAMMLRQALRGTPCRVFIADMKLMIESTDAVVYPDVFVSCDARDRGPDAELAQRYPQLVVEVLSESTAAYDRGRKFEAYRSIETLSAYLLVEQERQHAELFARNAEGLWVLNPIEADGSVPIASLNLTLPMAAVYEGVDRDEQPR